MNHDGITPRSSIAKRTPDAKMEAGTVFLMRIERWDVGRDGPLSEAALQHKVEALGYEPLPRPNPAGAIVSARIHPRERAEAVVAGLIKVTIEDESVILTAGDIVFIPGGAARRVEAVGTSPVYCLEAVMRIARA
jgi:mannose-6-phosphate isomerase-like protein (cupin superfamily)